ncbi:putative HNHc nuclease [Furfurilactobacillus siliginis]|uniref:Phage protein n=1 Tax=Furfurilactobacillus siliginis TaxID=348151 RepID=A0A0R2LE71_9LACO|nr:putative HNHc nuclease [Furfurilactobacillus siliginis]KRN96839.1 hypothetical protein IV55_GL000707 [Furfurilactobacillus siliginis]GEK28505.1 hypothetical protein LSI01_08160 [Furfurilactobacillus siliginis]
MYVYGRVGHRDGDWVTVKLSDMSDGDKFRIDKYGHGDVQVRIEDARKITTAQLKKTWAMIREVCMWQNDDAKSTKLMAETEQELKGEFYKERNEPEFSLSDCSLETANKFIDFLIMFCYREDIPWRSKTWDMIQGSYGAVYYGLKYRQCCICRNHAEIAHVHAVGSGRNRRTIDHRGNYVMPLCYMHHEEEQHLIGITTFMNKYHIKGIKVDDHIAKMLKLGNYRIIEEDNGDD